MQTIVISPTENPYIDIIEVKDREKELENLEELIEAIETDRKICAMEVAKRKYERYMKTKSKSILRRAVVACL